MTDSPFQIPIVIPAYEPDDKLIALVRDLRGSGFLHMIVVDDGSSADCEPLFEILDSEFGCTVLHHHVNQGKGRALKTAFHYCCRNLATHGGLITADADGQHSPACIQAVAEAMLAHPDALILGVRSFDEAGIPKKSEFGNRITRNVMKLLTGVAVSDTQTGLRGIPMDFVHALLSVKGERYEFETNMLLETRARKVNVIEVPIRTIYIDGNRSSHFHPLRDSIRIYMVFGKFIFSSIFASMIDMALFILLCQFLRGADFRQIPFFGHFSYITVATVLSRVCSAVFNYAVNRRVVFESDKTVLRTFPKYVLLAVVQMCLSAFLVGHIHPLFGGPEVLTKIPVDLCLFFISYFVQREVVYR